MTAEPSQRRAIITGITGQDGSYLAEQLLARDYSVIGLSREISPNATWRIRHLLDPAAGKRIQLLPADSSSSDSLLRLIDDIQPHEIYHLAAQSHVQAALEQPEMTLDSSGYAAIRLFEAVRRSGRPIKVCQASSSEIFGESPPPQSESSPIRPDNPYGLAKSIAHQAAQVYRQTYGLFIACAILFNHESPRRGERFVTRKISMGAARIARGLEQTLPLGDLNAERDWGYAPEYVDAMWRSLQHPTPEDFIIATGRSHTVKQFVAAAFEHVGLNWEDHVVLDRRFLRPPSNKRHIGDPSKARELLGWQPTVGFEELVGLMVQADLDALDAVRSSPGGTP